MPKIIVAILILSTSVFSQSPYEFLRFNHSARGTALAGAVASLDNDATLISYNPALMETVEDNFANFTFMQNVLDINSGNATYIYDGFDFGRLGFTANFNNWGEFQRTDGLGNSTGTFGGTDLSIGVYLSNELDSNFYYGIGIKYIYAGIDDVSGSAFAVDAGLFYKLNERTNLGVSVLNAGAQLVQYNAQNVPLPLDIRLSFNHRLRGIPLIVNGAFHSLADGLSIGDKLSNISAGLEIEFGKYVRGRLGYNNTVRQEASIDFDPGITGFTFGGGLLFNTARLDYSLAGFGSQATQHRITISVDI